MLLLFRGVAAVRRRIDRQTMNSALNVKTLHESQRAAPSALVRFGSFRLT
jgi:hypothetical protein